MPASWATRARQSRSVRYVDCMYLLALAIQLESVSGGACLLASERQRRKCFECMCPSMGFSNAAGKCLVCTCTSFRLRARECFDLSYWPVPGSGVGGGVGG